jgi:hypothetical protein
MLMIYPRKMEQGHWDAFGSSSGELEAAAVHVDGSGR